MTRLHRYFRSTWYERLFASIGMFFFMIAATVVVLAVMIVATFALPVRLFVWN